MLLITYANGSIRQGVLMAVWGNVMRVAIKDSDDLVEFRLQQNTWISEDCEPVTFEFPLAVFEAIGIMPPETPTFQPPVAADDQPKRDGIN